MFKLYRYNYSTRRGIASGEMWANSRWDVEEYCRNQPDYYVKNSEYAWPAF